MRHQPTPPYSFSFHFSWALSPSRRLPRRLPRTLLHARVGFASLLFPRVSVPAQSGAEQQLTDVTMRCSRCMVALCPVQVPEENHHDKATSPI